MKAAETVDIERVEGANQLTPPTPARAVRDNDWSDVIESQAMSQARGNEQAETAVKSAILATFADLAIENIDVDPGEDHAGEPMLYVTIHLKAKQKRISGSRLLDAIDAAATALGEIDDARFPYVTFLAPDYESAEDTRPAA